MVNNVGIIYLPDGLGHVALTVFFKDTEEGETREVEDKIAEISRYVYDYFYFTAAAPAGLASLDSMRSKSCIFLINRSTSCGYWSATLCDSPMSSRRL